MIAVLGAGAFGTALAVTLAKGGARVLLWARDPAHVEEMRRSRRNEKRLPGVELPEAIMVSTDMGNVAECDTVLVTVPAQQTAGFLAAHATLLDGKSVISCSKGIDLASGQSPATLIAAACPAATVGVLTGPSFAGDIARGLPTALTLACGDAAAGRALQAQLSTPTLRLYRTTDMAGAMLGGALKNVVAIAAGVVMGAGLGDSARAALMTRGYAEMVRLAVALGAEEDTLAGLSGLGDLVLTCTSTQSRNFRYGLALGAGEGFDPATTVEGAATAHAVAALAARHRLEMPVSAMVAALIDGKVTIAEAAERLLTRPLKEE